MPNDTNTNSSAEFQKVDSTKVVILEYNLRTKVSSKRCRYLDVEQQNYYFKRDATLRYFAPASSDKGGPFQKKEEITISKIKTSSGILHQSKVAIK